MNAGNGRVVIVTFYRFVHLPDYRSFQQPLLRLLRRHDVFGTLLLAPEGINGTIAGPREGIAAVLDHLRRESRFADLQVGESLADANPFHRRRVKLRKEIITMGVAGIDPAGLAGARVEAADWNQLVDDPEVLVLDTRNDYEVDIGTFENAVNPRTGSFREFPDYVRRHLDPARHRKVATFCTGGIRCEKSTAWLKQQGFDEVYQLRGGILNYLKSVSATESKWRGECFVFDDRVAVTHGLQAGSYEQCHACRRAISAQDRRSEQYRKGVSCPSCHGRHSQRQLTRYAERERQMELAGARGEVHIGAPMAALIAAKRREKLLFKERQRQAGKSAPSGNEKAGQGDNGKSASTGKLPDGKCS